MFSMERIPIDDFVECGAFQDLCTHFVNRHFDPSLVAAGDIVYVRSHWQSFFKKRHPLIRNPYVMLSNYHDRRIGYHDAIDDPKLLCWFGNNVDCDHPKIILIPHGLKYRSRIAPHLGDDFCRSILLYGNFSVESNPEVRGPLWDFLAATGLCTMRTRNRADQQQYAHDLQQSHFVVCPPGHGEDSYRIWEALACGAIPIVRHSFLDRLLLQLPALVIDDWAEITERLLLDTLGSFAEMQFDYALLSQTWWNRRICGTAQHETLAV